MALQRIERTCAKKKQQQTGDVYGFYLYVHVGEEWTLEKLADAVG